VSWFFSFFSLEMGEGEKGEEGGVSRGGGGLGDREEEQ
jgi:hypothetical protein